MGTPRAESVQGLVGNEREAANVYSSQKRTAVGDGDDSGVIHVQTPPQPHVLQIFTGGGDGLDAERGHGVSAAFGITVQVQSTKTLAGRKRLDPVVVDRAHGKAERFRPIVDQTSQQFIVQFAALAKDFQESLFDVGRKRDQFVFVQKNPRGHAADAFLIQRFHRIYRQTVGEGTKFHVTKGFTTASLRTSSRREQRSSALWVMFEATPD